MRLVTKRVKELVTDPDFCFENVNGKKDKKKPHKLQDSTHKTVGLISESSLAEANPLFTNKDSRVSAKVCNKQAKNVSSKLQETASYFHFCPHSAG
jgi:hypothetical protein